MPKQTDFETSSFNPPASWDALVEAARRATLPELPGFADLPTSNRELLFRDLGYTFWNRELADSLARRLLAEESQYWLELAAGTGRLTAELARRGVRIGATDDYSQAPEAVRGSQRPIEYGVWVTRLAARPAVELFRPQGVVCAWPPLGSCLVPELLAGQWAGSEQLQLIVCVGDPSGATEAPTHPYEIPVGWKLQDWPECARWLAGFNEPEDAPGSHSRLLIYRRVTREGTS